MMAGGRDAARSMSVRWTFDERWGRERRAVGRLAPKKLYAMAWWRSSYRRLALLAGAVGRDGGYGQMARIARL